jgi:hypothetical protein
VQKLYQDACEDGVLGRAKELELRFSWAAWEEERGELEAAWLVLALAPACPASMQHRADLEVRLGDLAAAEELLRAAQSLASPVTSPDISIVTIKLANFLAYRLNNVDDAVTSVDQGLIEDPGHSVLHATKLNLVKIKCDENATISCCDEALDNVTTNKAKLFFLKQKLMFSQLFGKPISYINTIEDNMQTVEQNVSEEICIECRDCDKTFSSTKNLRRHLKDHEDKIECEKCLMSFISLAQFQSHKTRKSCKFTCVCGAKFINKLKMEKHVVKYKH